MLDLYSSLSFYVVELALRCAASSFRRSDMSAEHDAACVPKLAQLYLDALVHSPVDNKRLYSLSTDELVELNGRLLKGYQAVKEELSQLKKCRYPVEPPHVQHGVGRDMYERVECVTRAWTPVPTAELIGIFLKPISDTFMHYGQPKSDIMWEEAIGQAVDRRRNGSVVQLAQFVGSQDCSQLLMYRLCCLFPCDVEALGPHGYKYVWSIYLKHKSTNIHVGFSEWKAFPRYLTSKGSPTGTVFDEDWLALLNLLIDPKCPHSYDGTVAGSIA